MVTCSSFLSVTSFADEFGTREEAVSLLDRAIALIRIDKNRALDLFTTGEGGFVDLQGTNLGEALFNAARVGQVGEATYEYKRPTAGSTKTFRKTALMTRVAGVVCGVGYYNPG